MAVTLTKLAAKEAFVSLDTEFTLLLSVKRLDSGDGEVALSAADVSYTIDPDTAPVAIPNGQNHTVVSVKVTLSGPALTHAMVIGLDGDADERHSTSVKVVP